MPRKPRRPKQPVAPSGDAGRTSRQLPLSAVTASDYPALPMPVASPCIDICRLDPATGWCVGCGRTGDEIAAWLTMSEAARHALLIELRGRPVTAKPAQPTAIAFGRRED